MSISISGLKAVLMENREYAGILSAIVLFLSLEWYSNLKVDPDTFTLLGNSGLQVMLDGGMRIGIIVILTVMIQLLSIKCNLLVCAVVTKILLCIVLITYPMVVYDTQNFAVGRRLK